MSPKRRSIISLLFTCLCFSKSLIIRILKRDDQLHFLRRLEHYSKKQINWDSSNEFLRRLPKSTRTGNRSGKSPQRPTAKTLFLNSSKSRSNRVKFSNVNVRSMLSTMKFGKLVACLVTSAFFAPW